MTVALSTEELAEKIEGNIPESVIAADENSVTVQSERLLEICRFLKESFVLDFDYLTNITGVDYFDYFEVVYHLISMKNNHSLTLKTRAYGRENPSVPSVTSLWRGAELQEREIYDLMGIRF